MPYRTATIRGANDAAVGCARCGALTSLAREPSHDGRFRCRKCEHDQPVLRAADDLALGELTITHCAMGSYDELTPFAKELGKDVQCGGLDLVCDGLPAKLGISVNSGTVVGLDHHVASAGLPKMRFVRELPTHVDAKASGTIKEVQTGDAAFDDEVYIESDASDADVLVVLESPAVRRAIRELFTDATAVVVNESGASVYVSRDRSPFHVSSIRDRLAWLRVIAGAPRPLATDYVAPPARARLAKRTVALALPLGVLLMIIGLAQWTPIESRPIFIGLGLGFGFAVFMLPIWTFLLRGRSTSHSEIFAWRVTTFVFAPVFVTGALLTANGAFDASEQRLVRMNVTEVRHDDEDHKFHVTASAADGSPHMYSFEDETRAGAIVEVGWRDGALGWTWESRPAVVLVEAPKP